MSFFNRNYSSLKREISCLKDLVDSFAQINSSLDLKTVLTNSLQTATRLMNAEIGSIALLNKNGDQLYFIESTDKNFAKLKELKIPLGSGIAGHVAKTGKSLRLDDAKQNPHFYAKIDNKMGQTTGSYLCSPLIANKKVIGTTQIMKKAKGASFTEDDAILLDRFASQVALTIENARAHKLELTQKKIEYEMLLCSQIQENFSPKSIPSIQGFEIFGTSSTAKEVGGDYYNYFWKSKECLDIIVADVSGKGISAALLVSSLHTCYPLISENNPSLKETAVKLNAFLCSTLPLGRFITVFIMRIYSNKTEVEYILAGHPPPILVSKQNTKSRNFTRTSAILGFDDKQETQVKNLELFSGDIVVAFSDGYSEAQNKKGEFFGEERISKIITKNQNRTLEDIYGILDSEVNKFCMDTTKLDDLTIALVRRQ